MDPVNDRGRGDSAVAEDGGVIVAVSGSASEEELETVAAAVGPYDGVTRGVDDSSPVERNVANVTT